MKNKYCSIAMLAMLALVACQEDLEFSEPYFQPQAVSQKMYFDVEYEPLEFELDDELEAELPATRSYIDANSSSWSYKYQTGDQIGLFYAHTNAKGQLILPYYHKTLGTYWMSSATGGKIKLSTSPGDNLTAGDYILSCSTLGKTQESIQDDQPSVMTMSIPAVQVTKYEPLCFNDGEGHVTYSSTNVLQAASDAMPRIGSPLRITNAMVTPDANGETAGTFSTIQFKNLGSVFEARIYSSVQSIGVGETIKSVTLQSTDGTQLAGTFTKSLLSSTTDNLNANGITGSDYVTADVEACDYQVGYKQANYIPVDIVLAPGTFPSTLTIETDQYRYTVNFESKQYKVNVRKSTYVNLAGATMEPVNFIPKYTLASSLANCYYNFTTGEEFDLHDSFFAQIMPNYGYEFTEGNVFVVMNGEDITAEAFDYSSGDISIYDVTGNIDVVVTATEIYVPVKYWIFDELSFCHFDEAIEHEIVEGESFSANIVPLNENYTITELTVTMGGVDVTDDVVGGMSGTFIYIEEVTGDVLIVAAAEKDETDENEGGDDEDDDFSFDED